MFILKILMFMLINRVISIEFVMKKNANNYGPYTVKWYNYQMCRGPKSKNATLNDSKFETGNYSSVVVYNTTFVIPTQIEELKVIVWNVNGDQKNLLWSYKVNKPCQHFAIAGFLNQYFHMLRNCYVKPGQYVYKTNYTQVANSFFGESFFYGDYSFKTNVLAKQGNVVCIIMNALFTKKV